MCACVCVKMVTGSAAKHPCNVKEVQDARNKTMLLSDNPIAPWQEVEMDYLSITDKTTKTR